MATTRSFAYNSGTGVTGTTQVGSIAAGNASKDYGSGLTWWNGPDEDLGYVIAHTSGSRTAGHAATNVPSPTIGFWRSTAKTDSSFLVLSDYLANQTFADADSAKTWLNSNGYWTSYTTWINGATSSVPGATVNGGVYNSVLSPFGSGQSYQFNGSSGYISYPASADYNLGTGDFTIEWFQYQTSQPSNPRIFQIGNYPSIAIGCSIEGSASSAIFYIWVTSPNNMKTFSASAHLNTWIHFAIVRISGSIKVYQNGVQIGSTLSNSTSLGNSTGTLSVGQESSATINSYFPGYLTQFRWTKGLGIYTGPFTVPTGPLTTTASANPFGGSNTSAITSGYVKVLLQ